MDKYYDNLEKKLKDNIVNGYLEHLILNYKKNWNNFLLFNSLFIDKFNIIKEDIYNNNFEKLRNITNRTLLFPICKNDHWFLLIIDNYENNNIMLEILDSKMNIIDEKMKKIYITNMLLSIKPFIDKILNFISQREISITYFFLDLQQNNDITNCGVFMLLIIHSFYFSKEVFAISGLNDLKMLLNISSIEKFSNNNQLLLSFKNFIIQSLKNCICKIQLNNLNNNNNNNNITTNQTKEDFKLLTYSDLTLNFDSFDESVESIFITDDKNYNNEDMNNNININNDIIDNNNNNNNNIENDITNIDNNNIGIDINNDNINYSNISKNNSILTLQTKFNNVISKLKSKNSPIFSNYTNNYFIEIFDKFEKNVDILLNNEQFNYKLEPKYSNMIKYDNIDPKFMHKFKVFRDIISINNFYNIKERKDYADKYLNYSKFFVGNNTIVINNIQHYFDKPEGNKNSINFLNPSLVEFQPTILDSIIISYMFKNFINRNTNNEIILICLFVFGKQSKCFIEDFIKYYNNKSLKIKNISSWLLNLKKITILYEPSKKFGKIAQFYTLNRIGYEWFEKKLYEINNLKNLIDFYQPLMESITEHLLLSEIEKIVETEISEFLNECYINNNHYAYSIKEIYELISKNNSNITFIIFNDYIEKQRKYINSLFLFYNDLICKKIIKNNGESILKSNLEIDYIKYIKNLDFKPFLNLNIVMNGNWEKKNNDKKHLNLDNSEFGNYFNCIEPIVINNITSTTIYHKSEEDYMYTLHKCDLEHIYGCCFQKKSSLLNNNKEKINVGDGLFTNVQIMKNTLLKVEGSIKKHTPSTKIDNTYLFSFQTNFNILLELDAKKTNENDKYLQSMAAYVNHPYDKKTQNVKSHVIPHILYQHDMFLIFTKIVQKDNEIYFDYGEDYWSESNNQNINNKNKNKNNNNNNNNNNKRKPNTNLNDNSKKQKLDMK